MNDVYTPPEVWDYDPANGGQFAGLNRPTAGAREEKALPVGEHPFQLYSLGTPNGVKATIMFEELLEAGFSGAEYDAWMIKIFEADQFGSGFVELNPNSKIPALLDRSGPEPFRVFESGAILVHLAEKFDYLLPKANPARAETFSWLMWQMGTAPFIGGGFGHFYVYAPERYKYPIDRYAMETKRISRWRTCSWRRPNTSPAPTTRSPTSPPTPGSAISTTAPTMARISSCPCTNTKTSAAG